METKEIPQSTTARLGAASRQTAESLNQPVHVGSKNWPRIGRPGTRTAFARLGFPPLYVRRKRRRRKAMAPNAALRIVTEAGSGTSVFEVVES